jgi:hypothetical protein
LVLVLALSACLPVKEPAPPPIVSTTPALFPAFQPDVIDYVDRCDPSTPTDVEVNAPEGTTVSVNGSPPASGNFSVQVVQAVGKRFTIDVTTNGATTAHYVRCIPSNFPNWSVEKNGPTQAEFYATSLIQGFAQPNYSVIFDSNGVPIWWLKDRHPTFFITPLLVDTTNFAIINIGDGTHMQEYDLNGVLVRSLNTVGGNADFHDVIQLPNGNFVMATAQNVPCDLSAPPWSIAPTVPPTVTQCINHVFQELQPPAVPGGLPVLIWSWDTSTHIPVAETAQEWIDQQKQTVTNNVYDPWHYNSIESTGDGYLLSFRHLNAVYKIEKAVTGNILWKLGGIPRTESLTLVNDPLGGPDSQHDARWHSENGTVSMFDNHTNGLGPPGQPRAVQYFINTNAKTATWAGQLQDAEVGSSGCCGTVRLLPGGGVVIGWGGTPQISEYAPDGTRVLRISGTFVYRGTPLPLGQFTSQQFRDGMDAQFP